MKIKTIFLILLFLILISQKGIFAQNGENLKEEILEGKVVKILKEDVILQEGQKNLYQKLKILITKGSLKGKEIEIEVGNLPLISQQKYKVDDEVLLSYSKNPTGEDIFFITDYIRRKPLIWLGIIFLILVIVVGYWRGLSSLLGLGVSFLVIFKYILPQISLGKDPVLIAIIGSLLIIPFTFYLSHGVNRKTTVAILGTFMALLITGYLAKIFVDIAKLTGYASEEAGFLQVAKGGTINIKGLLLAGIIIGALGVLDDITVSQSAVVEQLKKINPKISKKEIFWRSMSVGRDHIASMVNTLILVYTGAALPLLLLFLNNPLPYYQVINYEIIAEEVVRTLVGSIGLISAVPITTFLAVNILKNK
ncbi:MAG: YibE/F family protein [Microgenomates group bacterium]